MTTTRTLTSPRMALLEQLLLPGKATALELFWQEVAAHGAPLIETIDGDDSHALKGCSETTYPSADWWER